MKEKIVQTAGRNALGEFAPEFAHYNDDVLFGENWNNGDIDIKTRCLIRRFADVAGNYRQQSEVPHFKRKSARRFEKRNGGGDNARRILRRMAEGVGCVQSRKRGL